ncbi:MAG: hypothetical protein R2747_00775 [Pyrinomonadaceae bacterium]
MLNKNVIFRDLRLDGNFSALKRITSNIFELSEAISLHFAFTFLQGIAAGNGGKIKNLSIMCHGYGRKNPRKVLGAEVSLWDGGLGLQLGTEGLLEETVAIWAEIKNKVENIIVYSCGAADIQPGSGDGEGNGEALMKKLARETNANVFAADELQRYYLKGIDFSKWEGNLLCFTPSGQKFPMPNFIY